MTYRRRSHRFAVMGQVLDACAASGTGATWGVALVTVSPPASLVIGIASSAADRAQLARLLGSTEAFLLVSSAEQARAILDLAGEPAPDPPPVAAPAPVVPAPVVPASRADLSLDTDRRVLRWQDREVDLTRLEHDFLHCLAAERGQVWTYQRLHREVWGNEHLGRGSDIHSVVRRLRRKLARLEATVTIHVIRGVGLRLPPA
jgi:hypothetical protein